MERLKDRVAIIIGGTSGIGLACVELFAEEGANVIFAARKRAEGEKVEKQLLEKGLHASYVQSDVTDFPSLERLKDYTVEHYGKIDILVNCAGISYYKPFTELTMEEYQKTMDVNITGIFALCKLVVPVMIKQRQGSIVNISSIGGIVGNPNLTAYNASKGAVRIFTKGLAASVAEYNVRVNALMPGTTQTDMTQSNAGFVEMAAKRIPLKRAAKPREIAYGALFLASDESSFATGSEIVLDGGITSTIMY